MYGKPKEKDHYLKCEKFNSKSLVGITLKGLKGPLGLWLTRESIKFFID